MKRTGIIPGVAAACIAKTSDAIVPETDILLAARGERGRCHDCAFTRLAMDARVLRRRRRSTQGPHKRRDRFWQSNERPQATEEGAEPPLEGSRRAHAAKRAQQQPEIQCTGMQQYAFENIVVSAQMRASHPAG